MVDKYHSDFKLCRFGTYLSKGGELKCNKCLQNGICEGGYIDIYPKKGVIIIIKMYYFLLILLFFNSIGERTLHPITLFIVKIILRYV